MLLSGTNWVSLILQPLKRLVLQQVQKRKWRKGWIQGGRNIGRKKGYLQRSPRSTVSNSDHTELRDVIPNSESMIFTKSTLLQATASSFPTLAAGSCSPTSHQKLGGRGIRMLESLAGIWQTVKSVLAVKTCCIKDSTSFTSLPLFTLWTLNGLCTQKPAVPLGTQV